MTAIRTDLGRRVELVSMDPRGGDISIGLYVSEDAAGPLATVHSYSSRPGTPARLAEIAAAMCALGGLDPAGPAQVRFACGTWHNAAARRLFIEAARHDPATPATPGPLELDDARTDQRISVRHAGGGAYRVAAQGASEQTPSRAPAIARAMAKLAELDIAPGEETRVSFACGTRHDELVGLLLARAQNLRQVLREEEQQSTRGVMAAPSAQE